MTPLVTWDRSQWELASWTSQIWSLFTSDYWVLQTVSKGYSLEFHRLPQDQNWPVLISRDLTKLRLKLKAIHHLLHIRNIEPVPLSQRGKGVYSVSFLVSKKNGDWRAILELKWLNRFIKKRKFKMETWRSIVASLQRGDYLTSVDLTEAYLHIPILEKHRKYLRFCYGT